MDYINLQGLAGADNSGGYDKVFFAPKSWIDTFPPKKTTTNPGDSVTLNGDITFKDPLTQGFLEAYTTQDTEQLKAEIVGERDGKSFKQTLTFFHPGDRPETAEFFASSKNDQFVVLVRSCETGRVLVLGSECAGAEIVGAFDSGTRSSGRKGWTVTVEFFSGSLLYYEGTIALKP